MMSSNMIEVIKNSDSEEAQRLKESMEDLL